MAKLTVNVDHVATVRQARGVDVPDPVLAAGLAELAGRRWHYLPPQGGQASHQRQRSPIVAGDRQDQAQHGNGRR